MMTPEIEKYLDGSLSRFVKSFPRETRLSFEELRHHLVFDVAGRFPDLPADSLVDQYLSNILRAKYAAIYTDSIP